MNESIEFHDSRVTSVAFVGTSIQIDLRAYVHRWEKRDGGLSGTGWFRPVRIVLSDAIGDVPTDLPLDLDGGEVRSGQLWHNNLVPLPFSSEEATNLLLEGVTGGMLEFAGRSVAIESIGDAEYVEDLPEDFAPSGTD
jgi:hypothetical protein